MLKIIHGYRGTIFLINKPLEDVTRAEIAKYIAYVPQKPFIFSGTVKENIVYGCDGLVENTLVIEAAKNACIHEEIISKFGGYDGKITENGNNLSGGQRQRLAIARVMLQAPELIIFDEATSALDNINEAKIQQNIEKVFHHKTVISIAHRLTTLKSANRIYVFDHGKITQSGDFKSLSNEFGLFQDLLKQRIR